MYSGVSSTSGSPSGSTNGSTVFTKFSFGKCFLNDSSLFLRSESGPPWKFTAFTFSSGETPVRLSRVSSCRRTSTRSRKKGSSHTGLSSRTRVCSRGIPCKNSTWRTAATALPRRSSSRRARHWRRPLSSRTRLRARLSRCSRGSFPRLCRCSSRLRLRSREVRGSASSPRITPISFRLSVSTWSCLHWSRPRISRMRLPSRCSVRTNRCALKSPSRAMRLSERSTSCSMLPISG
mmetsp:Transcript_12472/g.19949  ORF Transcript_12472/g.19949 Transcript_12472/m.19949 type:complete len:235 (-) Transcript_12472:689-1393(-)